VAIALEERDNSALEGRPLAIEAPQPGPRTVYDLSYAASLAGVSRGMDLTQARKLCPEISILPPRLDAYRDTFQILLELLAEFAPAVEPVDLERSWLSATEIAAGVDLERTLAQELVTSVRSEIGLASRVGLAHGKLTSKIVTQYLEQRDVMILPGGKEVAFLGGLATRYLPISLPNLQRIRQLGLTKIHQYAALPSPGILPRFGYEGLRSYRLAHGHDDARVRAWQSEPFLEAKQAFAEPIDNLHILRHNLERLANRVSRPLADQYKMAAAIELTIVFDDGQTVVRRRTLTEPVCGPQPLLIHIDAMMAHVTWGAPVERVTLAAQGLCPTVGRQLELFRKEHEARAGVETTLRRIQARHGPDTVQQGHVLEPLAPLPERRAYLATWES
jgi:DNA polymerase-4